MDVAPGSAPLVHASTMLSPASLTCGHTKHGRTHTHTHTSASTSSPCLPLTYSAFVLLQLSVSGVLKRAGGIQDGKRAANVEKVTLTCVRSVIALNTQDIQATICGGGKGEGGSSTDVKFS